MVFWLKGNNLSSNSKYDPLTVLNLGERLSKVPQIVEKVGDKYTAYNNNPVQYTPEFKQKLKEIKLWNQLV